MSKKIAKQPNAVAPSNLKINTASEADQKKSQLCWGSENTHWVLVFGREGSLSLWGKTIGSDPFRFKS